MLRFGFLFFAVLIQVALALPADAAKRVALVIGNAAYSQAGTLANPVNDATDMANALKKFGFEVILGLDLDRRGNVSTQQTYRTTVERVYACGDARIGQSLIVTAIAEGRKCARIVNKDLGGSAMDADREKLAIGAWSGEPDHTLRHEAETAGTIRPGEEFFTGPGQRRR